MSVFLPFAYDILPMPKQGETVLTAGLTQVPEQKWQNILVNHLPWRPDFLAFEQKGFQCFPSWGFPTWQSQKNYDGGLLELGKHKGQNQNRFLTMLRQIKAKGFLVVSGEKKSGIDSFIKWAKKIVTIDDKLSKNHGVAFWLRVPEKLDTALLENAQSNPIVFFDDEQTKFITKAGMFSHGKVDIGSQMLIDYFEKIAFGYCADFGAGWGYLSTKLLQQKTKVTSLDLYEADYNALEAAKKHIQALHTEIAVNYHWFDLTSEPINGIYDTIIANPPFHAGREANIALGQKFIEVAAKRLKIGGCLLMVANRQLAYEDILKSNFRKVITHKQENGFKIIAARK